MRNIDVEKPYNDLPKLPPKSDVETKLILKQLNLSSRALSELRGYSEIVPNKDILINSIVLKEAKDSSEIENIITTHDDLYKALVSKSKNIDPHTKEVLNYRRALNIGYEFVKKNKIIVTNTIIDIQQELEQNTAGIRRIPGTSLKNDRAGEIIYTPPEGENRLRDLLKNLEDYINIDDDTDPLIKMAIIHYQFESIHPFFDGNGRTGRIINVLYLVLKDLLDSPLLYLSSYIIKHKLDYYRLLQEVRISSNWEDWIIFMLKAVEETSKETLELLRKIKLSIDNAIENIKYNLPEMKDVIELTDCIYYLPYTRIKYLEEKLSISRQTSSRYLKRLEEIGLLKSIKKGRDYIYLNINLYNLLK